jgi:tetratricopeptide (TPR) repeat protein
MRRALPALLFTAWTMALPGDAMDWVLHPHLPTWAERWLYNARERTDAAIDAAHAGDAKRADDFAETAARLAPDSPLAHYNAGTARLGAGRKDAAQELETALKSPTADLAADGAYNLGNARLAAGDSAGAVEAYEQALRSAPDHGDAKYNLELAIARRDRDRLRTRSPREGPQGDRGGGNQNTQSSGNEGQADKPRNTGASDPGRSLQQGQQSGPTGRPGQASPHANGQALPGYTDQPEMNASEAANLLRAVENLERQQRREAAARIARQRAAQGKDW